MLHTDRSLSTLMVFIMSLSVVSCNARETDFRFSALDKSFASFRAIATNLEAPKWSACAS